jgi:transcription initiation factor IIE alpha subunit
MIIKCPKCGIEYPLDRAAAHEITCLNCGEKYIQCLHRTDKSDDFVRQALHRTKGG